MCSRLLSGEVPSATCAERRWRLLRCVGAAQASLCKPGNIFSGSLAVLSAPLSSSHLLGNDLTVEVRETGSSPLLAGRRGPLASPASRGLSISARPISTSRTVRKPAVSSRLHNAQPLSASSLSAAASCAGQAAAPRAPGLRVPLPLDVVISICSDRVGCRSNQQPLALRCKCPHLSLPQHRGV